MAWLIAKPCSHKHTRGFKSNRSPPPRWQNTLAEREAPTPRWQSTLAEPSAALAERSRSPHYHPMACQTMCYDATLLDFAQGAYLKQGHLSFT